MSERACPFPGLLPFQEKDADFFFGRERETAELLKRMEERRFLAVIGVSGSGKSSLVRAGLKPELRFGATRWRIVEVKPGEGPQAKLLSGLQQEIPRPDWQDLLSKSSYGLVDGVKLASGEELAGGEKLAEGEKLLILVDQFEEIFAYRKEGHAEEADLFVQQLLRASAEPGVPVYVMLTMRSDFLGHCALFRNLPEALNEGTYLVPRLTRHEQEEAIRSPLAAAGVEIEPGVVDELLNAAEANRDELPVLQHLLKRLWEEWDLRGAKGAIGREDYKSSGGWKDAISEDGNAVLKRLSPNEQWAAKLVFQRITEKGTGERPIRKPCSLADLGKLSGWPESYLRDKVLASFRKRDLVVWESEERIDIPHECVTWRWGQLEQWIEEEAADARRLEYMTTSAAAKNWLVGSTLDEAIVLRPRLGGTWAARYGVDGSALKAFVDSCERAARAAGRRAWWQRVIGAFVVVVIAGLGLWAWGQKGLADRQRAAAALSAQQAIAERKTADEQKGRAEIAERDALANLQKSQVSQAAAEEAAARATVSEGKARAQAEVALARQLASRSELVFGENLLGLESAVLLSTRSLRMGPSFESDRALRRPLSLLARTQSRMVHEGRVNAAAWSPDGKRVATGSSDKTARVMDAVTGQELARLMHEEPVNAVAWSPDGKRVATGSDDKTARLMDAVTGQELARLMHKEPVNAVAWSPDGKRLATGSEDSTVRVMDAATGQQLAELEHEGSVTAVAWSPDGKRLATGSEDSKARVMDAATGQQLAELEHEGSVTAVAWSPDGNRVATGSEDTTARVMDAVTGKEIARLAHERTVTAVAWSPDGKRVATGSWDRTARVMDAATGKELARLAHEDKVAAVAWSPDGKQVATGSADKTARVMDAATGQEIARLTKQGGVSAMAWSPDGRRVATGSRNRIARVMDVATGKELARLAAHRGVVNSVAWSPDGTRVATGSDDMTARVMDAATGKEIARLAHSARVTALAWSPDGKRLATGSWDRKARVMDAATGKEIARVAHQGPVSALAWSPDGKRLATGSSVGTARVMDSATGKELARLRHEGSRVIAVAWSRDGKRVATGGSDGTARVMDSATGQELARLAHQGPVTVVAWSPDSKWVATMSNDVRLMDAASGEERVRIGIRGAGAHFSGDGRFLEILGYESTSKDLVLSRHPLDPQDLIAEACGKVTRNLSVAEWQQYVGREIPYARSCENLPFPPDYKR